MRIIHSVLMLLFLVTAAGAGDQIYVITLADAQAPLSGGGTITMEKGDYYQFIGYDSSQTQLQLRIGQFTFWTRETNVQFVAKANTATAAKRYAADTAKFLAVRQAAIQRVQQRDKEEGDTGSVFRTESPRDAADAYIAELKEQGIIFASKFRTVFAYPNLFPRKAEVIYVLDYKSQAGVRLVAPYTITTKQTGSGWEAIGGTPGDRTADLNTDPVRSRNGRWQRSPMEEFMGDAMNRGMSR